VGVWFVWVLVFTTRGRALGGNSARGGGVGVVGPRKGLFFFGEKKRFFLRPTPRGTHKNLCGFETGEKYAVGWFWGWGVVALD